MIVNQNSEIDVNFPNSEIKTDYLTALNINKIKTLVKKNGFSDISDQSLQEFLKQGITVKQILSNFGIEEDINLPDRQKAFLLENKFLDLKLEKGSVETVIISDWNECIERFANPDTRHKNITNKMKQLLTLVETHLRECREIDIKTAEDLQKIKQFTKIAKIMRNAIMLVQNPIFQKLYDPSISEEFSEKFILNKDEMECLHSLYRRKLMKDLNSIHSMKPDKYDKKTVSEVWNSCINLIADDKENFKNANNQIARLNKMEKDASDRWNRMADILNDYEARFKLLKETIVKSNASEIVYEPLSEKEISSYQHLRVKMINATDAAMKHMHIVGQQLRSLNHRNWVAPHERIKTLFYLFLFKMSSMFLYTAIKLANLSLGFP